ncbi:MAG: hypothetical protein ACN4G0_06170 [Polyangiales bacterium]
MKLQFWCGLCVCALSLFPFVGCTEETSSGTGGSGASGGDGGAADSEGLCENSEDSAVFETLEYSSDDDEVSTGVDAAIAMTGDCIFGEPPRCGAELAAVIVDNSDENNAAFAACEVTCVSMQADLSLDCLSCFADVVVCASANCITECARGAFLPECRRCRIEEDCDSGFGECSGVAATPSFEMLTVTVTEPESFEKLFDGPPLEGVEVCETDTETCATTDADGIAEIEVTANTEVTYTLTKEGYLPYLVPVVPVGPMSSFWPMLSDQIAEDFADTMMTPYPFTAGLIALAALPTMPGATFDVVGETVPGYYNDENGTPVPTLTATTSFGRGGFVEVSPGEQEIEFGGTASDCRRSFGWPADAPNRIRLPVEAGYITYGSMNNCDAP